MRKSSEPPAAKPKAPEMKSVKLKDHLHYSVKLIQVADDKQTFDPRYHIRGSKRWPPRGDQHSMPKTETGR